MQRLAEIRVPTLVIVGDRDVPAVHTVVELLETSIAGARKVVIHGAAHLSNMEKPEEFNKAVLEFLGDVWPGLFLFCFAASYRGTVRLREGVAPKEMVPPCLV